MTMPVSLVLYFAVFIFSAVCIYLGNLKKYPKLIKTIFVIIGIVTPTVLCWLRYNVGSDFLDYEHIYNYAIKNSFDDFNLIYANRSIEPSFYILSNVSNYIVGNSSLLFGFYGFLTITLYYLSAKYFSPKWAWLSFFVFLCIYFPIGLSAVRQFAAAAIFLFSIRYIINGKYVRYIIAIVIASLFHQTSIILLSVYLLGRYFLRNKSGWRHMMPVIISGVVLVATPIVNIILTLPLLSRYGYMADLERGASYVGGTYLMQLLILLVLALFFKGLFSKDITYRVLFPMFLTGILLYGVGFRFSSGWRLALYMLPVAPLLIPSVIDPVRGWLRSYMVLAVLIFSVLYFVAVYYISGNFDIFPLNFIRS